jgi:hypothetical protein
VRTRSAPARKKARRTRKTSGVFSEANVANPLAGAMRALLRDGGFVVDFCVR